MGRSARVSSRDVERRGLRRRSDRLGGGVQPTEGGQATGERRGELGRVAVARFLTKDHAGEGKRERRERKES